MTEALDRYSQQYYLKPEWKDRLAQVELVHAMLCEQLGLEPDELVILGGAIRDLMVGQAPRDWDAYIIGGNSKQTAKILTRLAGRLFPWDGRHSLQEPLRQQNDLFNDPYDSDRSGVYTAGHYDILGYNVNLCTAPAYYKAVQVDWNCCNGYYWGSEWFRLDDVAKVIDSGVLQLNNRDELSNVKRTYERGLEFQRRYGWAIAPEDAKWLWNEFNEPEVEVELIRGYRGYRYEPTKQALVGATRQSWDSVALQAQCKTAGPDDPNGARAEIHLRRGTCRCGIYAFKGLPSRDYLQMGRGDGISVLAQVTMYGYLIELEIGYRSQYARLERLFIFTDSMYQDGRNTQHPENFEEAARVMRVKYGVPVEVLKSHYMYQFTPDGVVVKPSIAEPYQWPHGRRD